MTVWMLYVILSTGEAGPVPASEHVCRLVVSELAAKSKVEAELHDGTMLVIESASCLGPVGVDPCEMEAAS